MLNSWKLSTMTLEFSRNSSIRLKETKLVIRFKTYWRKEKPIFDNDILGYARATYTMLRARYKRVPTAVC